MNDKQAALLTAAILTNAALAGNKPTATSQTDWNSTVWQTLRTFYGGDPAQGTKGLDTGVVGALEDNTDWKVPTGSAAIPSQVDASVWAVLQKLLGAIPLPPAGANNPVGTVAGTVAGAVKQALAP